MYGATVSKLTEKSQNDTKKREKVMEYRDFVEQVKRTDTGFSSRKSLQMLQLRSIRL